MATPDVSRLAHSGVIIVETIRGDKIFHSYVSGSQKGNFCVGPSYLEDKMQNARATEARPQLNSFFTVHLLLSPSLSYQ